MEIRGKELVNIYLLLKNQENALDSTQEALMNRIQTVLYDHLSIEEMENLDEVYESQTLFPF